MSSYGKGDIREPFVEITYADGSFSSDFKFDHADIMEEKEAYETLPGSYATEEEGVEQLTVVLKEQASPVYLELHYYVYEKSDVITRSAKLCNEGDTPIPVCAGCSAHSWIFRIMTMWYQTFTAAGRGRWNVRIPGSRRENS